MPLNGSGGVTQPASSIYPAAPNTLIESAKFNISIADIYSILASAIYKDGQQVTTQRIPFAAGIQTDTVTEKTVDTGVTLDSVLLKDGRIDTTQGADIVCSATINLETATGNVVDVTGSTGPVTAITLSQGHFRVVRFTGTPTLTHGASLVLPGAADITAAAGDYALFAGYASSVVRCVGYFPSATTLPRGKVLMTEQATTSGASKDFTGIASWARRITVMFNGVSTNGASPPLIQIGDAGGVEDTGYSSAGTELTSGGNTVINLSNGFNIASQSSNNVIYGSVTLTLEDASDNTWTAQGVLCTASGINWLVSGSKALSATLDRVRLTTNGGTDAFDLGSMNVAYE